MRKTAVYVALLAVMSSSFVTVLNTNMTHVISPNLVEAFGLDYSQLTWIFTSYQIIYAVLMPVFGKLGDRSGRRRCLLVGLCVFGIGSLLSGLSWNYASLVAFRVLQGIGASAIFPNATVLATSLFPPDHRGKIMGIWGMTVSLGSVTGPSIGGLIVRYLGWKSIFFVNAPCALLAMTAIMLATRSDSTTLDSFRFDTKGAVLLLTMVVTLVTVIQNGPTMGWASPSVILMLLVLTVSVPSFVLVENRITDPLIDPKTLTNKTFLAGVYCGGMHLVAIQGMHFLMPLFMGQVLGLDPLTIGILMAPQAAIRLVVSPIAGVLEDKYTSRIPVTVGIVVRSIALASFAYLTQESSRTFLTLSLLLDGVGAALIWSPSINAVLKSYPRDMAAYVTGVYNMIRFVMGVVGVGLIGLVLDKNYSADFVSNSPVPGYYQSYIVLAGVTALGLLFVKSLGKQADFVGSQTQARRMSVQ
jgi:EmrB/QacA subfamily drug resistance transporter